MNPPSEWLKNALASQAALPFVPRAPGSVLPVHRLQHVFIQPWKTGEVVFRVEQTCMLRDLLMRPTHALTLMETRLARRMKHSWRSDKARRDAWTLMARMNARRTRGTFVSALMSDNTSLLDWRVGKLFPTEVAWPFVLRLPAVALELGKTLTLRVRNGCQPLTWSVALVGLEAARTG